MEPHGNKEHVFLDADVVSFAEGIPLKNAGKEGLLYVSRILKMLLGSGKRPRLIFSNNIE